MGKSTKTQGCPIANYGYGNMDQFQKKHITTKCKICAYSETQTNLTYLQIFNLWLSKVPAKGKCYMCNGTRDLPQPSIEMGPDPSGYLFRSFVVYYTWRLNEMKIAQYIKYFIIHSFLTFSLHDNSCVLILLFVPLSICLAWKTSITGYFNKSSKRK